jgi:hypothetical protein
MRERLGEMVERGQEGNEQEVVEENRLKWRGDEAEEEGKRETGGGERGGGNEESGRGVGKG